MADKPRVRAPKQRATPKADDPARNRRMMLYGAGVTVALAAFAAAVFLVGFGGDNPSPEKVRADLEAAGCELQAVDAQRGQHSLGADDTVDWNTDPPTSGPHFGFDEAQNLGTVIWGAYEEPLQLARVVHNLEHGGIYIFYGDEVPDAIVTELRGFYDSHERGTLLAPYSKLGDQIALGAWVSEGGEAKGYLAKCSAFDEAAFSAFFDGFQFKGPERFPPDSLLPGNN
ncbi:MAG: DUF3105 domain-containing protein [Actinobacteria bacterium]|nr:DUF3105 domain-containing protein [Actinomycetota bacterium]